MIMDEKDFNKLLAEKVKGKNVLITGGLGMIGSNIAHLLVQMGARVAIADPMITPYGANLFNLKGIKDKIELQYADIRDREAFKELVKERDVIFNLAAQVSHNDSVEDPFLDADINYLGHLNVVESLRKYNPKAKIIHSGSRLQFGEIHEVPVNESCPLNPKTPYGVNKTAAEYMYRYYSEVHGISCVLLRIANPYGIRCQMKHSKYAIVNFFIRLAMEGKDLTVYGDGSQLRDYIYVEDLALSMLASAFLSGEGINVYNLGSGMGTSFKDMVQTIIDVTGSGKLVHVPWPEEYLNVETGNYITDITRIKTDTGWEPHISLEEGIRRTMKFYQDNLDRYKEG